MNNSPPAAAVWGTEAVEVDGVGVGMAAIVFEGLFDDYVVLETVFFLFYLSFFWWGEGGKGGLPFLVLPHRSRFFAVPATG